MCQPAHDTVPTRELFRVVRNVSRNCVAPGCMQYRLSMRARPGLGKLFAHASLKAEMFCSLVYVTVWRSKRAEESVIMLFDIILSMPVRVSLKNKKTINRRKCDRDKTYGALSADVTQCDRKNHAPMCWKSCEPSGDQRGWELFPVRLFR